MKRCLKKIEKYKAGPPDDDESVTEEPEQAGKSKPLLVNDKLVHNK
jgi:hypothetical protein